MLFFLLCLCFRLHCFCSICVDIKRCANFTENELIVLLRRLNHGLCLSDGVLSSLLPTRFKNLAHNYWRSLKMHIDYVALLLIRVFQFQSISIDYHFFLLLGRTLFFSALNKKSLLHKLFFFLGV